MTLITSFDHDLSTRRRLPGTAHRGPEWKAAVGLVRSALQNAVAHVDWQSRLTADQVGMRVLDHIGELDARALRMLAIVLGILVRLSRKDGRCGD
ncbi:MAG: hypothetical protein WAK04_08400 [Xanthobacteraceae bacterium]